MSGKARRLARTPPRRHTGNPSGSPPRPPSHSSATPAKQAIQPELLNHSTRLRPSPLADTPEETVVPVKGRKSHVACELSIRRPPGQLKGPRVLLAISPVIASKTAAQRQHALAGSERPRVDQRAGAERSGVHQEGRLRRRCRHRPIHPHR